MKRQVVRRCGGCKGMVRVDDAEWPVVKRMLTSFAARHAVHHDAVSSVPIRRCGACGLLLLFDDRCAGHYAAERIDWTGEHEAAAAAWAESERAGTPPEMPAHAEAANVWVLVRRLRERWAERGELVEVNR